MGRVEKSSSVDIEALCRMCHHDLKDDKSSDIFGSETAASSPVAAQIMIFGGIDISPADSLPKRLCLECRLQLEKSHLFRMTSKNLDAKMRKHLRITNAGRESRVFDEDEHEDEYTESMKIIDAISKQLAVDQKMDMELAKKRIYDEAAEIFEEKLKAVEAEAMKNAEQSLHADLKTAEESVNDALEKMSQMTEAHQAEIKRITAEADAKLVLLMENEPPLKRKQASTSRESCELVVTNDGAVPVTDSTDNGLSIIMPMNLDDLKVEQDENDDNGPGPTCDVCKNGVPDELQGQFSHQRNNEISVFCSEICSNWFDINFAHKVLCRLTGLVLSNRNAWEKHIESDAPEIPVKSSGEAANALEVKQEGDGAIAKEQSELATTRFTEQQFLCDQCPKHKPFKSNAGLRKHVKGVHSGVVFKCKYCCSRCKHEKSIRAHYRESHPGHPFDYEKDESK